MAKKLETLPDQIKPHESKTCIEFWDFLKIDLEVLGVKAERELTFEKKDSFKAD